MNYLLKEQLGFKGFIMSDWWATHSTENAANSGLDMTMPGNYETSRAVYVIFTHIFLVKQVMPMLTVSLVVVCGTERT